MARSNDGDGRAPSGRPSLFDPEFLVRLEYLYIMTRDLFVGHVAADRLSKKFGVGTEFADFRPYVPGDDFRHIDWAAYARRDALTVKLFSEENELPIYLAIDASLSMLTGDPEKLFFAKKIAAALGYIGLANEDPVTIVSFDEALRPGSRQFHGRGQLSAMIAFLDAIEGKKRTNLTRCFAEFVRRYSRRGLVVLLSDCFDPGGYAEAIRLLHYHRFDLLVLQVNARDEVEPALGGDVELVDSETAETLTIKLTPALHEEYQQRFIAHYAELKTLCRLLRRSYLPVVTDAPFEQLIFDVFRRGGFLR
jgi:uncharacterized protein (DUF58 family)